MERKTEKQSINQGLRTVETYKKEILEKYKREQGGKMSIYLAQPTRSNIREACLFLLDTRNDKYDEQILERFFNFEEGKSKYLTIQKTKGYKADIYRPVVNFLIGETKDTSIKNLELIGWLIDFKPRPLSVYLRLKPEVPSIPPPVVDKPGPPPVTPPDSAGDSPTGKSPKKYYLEITIGVILSVFLTIFVISKVNEVGNARNSSNKCMAWAETSFKEISCDLEFHPDSGTKTEPYDPKRFKSFKKVEVTQSYDFFINNNMKKPRVWYYKNKKDEIEYFTSSGIHPVNGETLKKITPYIIETYVPKHTFKPNSFIDRDSGNK